MIYHKSIKISKNNMMLRRALISRRLQNWICKSQFLCIRQSCLKMSWKTCKIKAQKSRDWEMKLLKPKKLMPRITVIIFISWERLDRSKQTANANHHRPKLGNNLISNKGCLTPSRSILMASLISDVSRNL